MEYIGPYSVVLTRYFRIMACFEMDRVLKLNETILNVTNSIKER
ncbi:MAG: hypothetical protein K0Q73_6447 [Paenibacillus sp.]|jgi:hypothetical protein|nr:hypothetical protein [Paenibacillus sp.]